MTLSLFWFHVMLPYVFLMNTSHNKKLVIDDGWLNTIQNTLGLSENVSPVPCQCLPVRLRLLTFMRRGDIERNQKDANTNPRSKEEDTLPNTPLGCGSDTGSQINGDIYVISKSVISTSLSEKESIQSMNVLSEIPSNSKRLTKTKHRKDKIGVIKKFVSESDEDRSSPQKSHRLCVGEEFLSYMFIHIDNEEAYLHYLKQLSRFEETFSKGLGLHEEFRLEDIVEFPAPKRNRIKNLTFQLKDPTNIEDSKSRNKKRQSKNTSSIDQTRSYRLIGKVSDRIKTRKNLFERFQGYRDDDCYNKFLEALFNIEENFTYG